MDVKSYKSNRHLNHTEIMGEILNNSLKMRKYLVWKSLHLTIIKD